MVILFKNRNLRLKNVVYVICVNRVPNDKKYETLLSTSEFVHASSKIR